MSRTGSATILVLVWVGLIAASRSEANAPPVLPEFNDVVMTAGKIREVGFYASDVDGNVMTARKVSGPSFVTVASQGSNPGNFFGLITLQPSAADVGDATVNIGVSDGIVETTASFRVSVHATGEPVFTKYADMVVGAELAAMQTVWAADPDVNDLTFFKVSGPGYMTVQTMNSYGSYAYADVTIKPGLSDIGHAVAEIGVSDGTNTTTVAIQIDVLPACPSTHVDPVSLPWTPRTSLLGDVNGDGKLDLVAFSGYTLDAAILHGNGDGTFGTAIPFTAFEGQRLLADFNGDGRKDLAITSGYSAQVRLANAAGEFGPGIDAPWDGSFTSPSSFTSGDLNGDGHQDLVLAYSGISQHLRVLLGDGTGAFTLGPSADVSSTYGALTTADFDGDGHLDVALGLYYAKNVLTLLGDGAGGLGTPTPYAVSDYGAHFVAAGDVNGDGRPDLAVAHDGLSVLLNDGSGHFPTFQTVPSLYRIWSVAFGDFTGDGRRDLLATGEEWFDHDRGASLVFPGTGSGTFGPPTGAIRGGLLEGIALGDINRDGRLDWLTTDRDAAINLFVNDGCGDVCPSVPVELTLTPRTLNLQSQGRWVTATLEPDPPALAEDIDVGEILLNRILHVDPSAPTSIGDSDNDGRPDLTVKFDRAAVELGVSEGEAVTVTVSGEIGTSCFESTDHIRVIRGRIVAPSAGSVLQVDSPTEVRWETPADATVPWVSLLRSSDGGRNWIPVTSHLTNTGTYSWMVPDGATDDARIAVLVDDESGGVLGISERFAISSAPLDVGQSSADFALHGTIPNPSRGLTVSFSLPEVAPASLAVYDVSGRQVSRREVGGMGAGRHVIILEPSGALAPGVYLVHLTQGARNVVSRAVVIP